MLTLCSLFGTDLGGGSGSMWLGQGQMWSSWVWVLILLLHSWTGELGRGALVPSQLIPYPCEM